MRTNLLMFIVEVVAVLVGLVAVAHLVGVWWAVLLGSIVAVVVLELWSNHQ